MICVCGKQLTTRNKPGSDGVVRCARCAKARRQDKYSQSEKGKTARKQFEQTDTFKATQKRYLQTDKGKVKQKRYAQSDKGKAVFAKKQHERYWSDPEYYRKKALQRRHGIPDYQLDRCCAFCGTTANLSLDHMHPQAKGGTGHDNNLWTLCISCNSFKGDRLVTVGAYPGVLL